MNELLKFRLRCYWNGNVVMDARASATMAYEAASGFVADSFGGQRSQEWVEDVLSPALQPLLADPEGDHIIDQTFNKRLVAPFIGQSARVLIERTY